VAEPQSDTFESGLGRLEALIESPNSPLKADVETDISRVPPAPKDPEPEPEPEPEPAKADAPKSDDPAPDAKKSVYERGVETFDDLAELFDLDTEKLSEHLKIKGANGELVPLKTILDAHVNAPEMTKRQAEMDAYRSHLETAARNLEFEKLTKVAEIDALTVSLKNQLAKQEAEIDWKQLEEEDPIGFFKKRDELRENHAKIHAAEQAAQVEREKQMAIDGERARESLRLETVALMAAKPEWKDPKLFAEEMAGVRTYLKEKGISDAAIDTIDNHAFLLIAWEGAQFRRLKSGAVLDAHRVPDAPKLIKPNARGDGKTESHRKTEELRRTLKRTGSEEAALELIRGMV